jgi:ATP-dependent Lhr-like helicase
LTGGRWSLVSQLAAPAAEETVRRVALAEMLLERYGVVSREAVACEGIPGGFAAVYRVLRAMEDAGRVRRGYFVEGLGSAQFAHVGTVDRLRAAREEPDPMPDRTPEIGVMAAVDPANPWGTVVPWPDVQGGEGTRPRRVPGAWVILADGAPALYVASGGRQLITFDEASGGAPATALPLALCALTTLPRRGRRTLLVVEKVNAQPVAESSLVALLTESGFVRDYRGMTFVPESRAGSRGGSRAGG